MKLQQRSLIKFSLIGFLVCFCLLYFIEYNFELDASEISDIDLSNINDKVRLEGRIISQRSYSEVLIIRILGRDGKIISGVIFGKDLEKFDLSLEYFFEGKIGISQMEPQIVINKVYVKNGD